MPYRHAHYFVGFVLLVIMAAFMMIINVSAARYTAADAGEGIRLLGPAFGIGMGIAIAAYLTLFYQALKHRRNIKLHAGYMLATPLILFESPFSRVIDEFLPWMNVINSDGPRNVLDTIVISNALGIVFALWFAPDVPLIGRAFAAYATIPPGVALALGMAAGGAAAWLGWQAGKPERKSVAQPA